MFVPKACDRITERSRGLESFLKLINMKIGGRIIQNKNISVSIDKKFSATYKKHYIEIEMHENSKKGNPIFSVDVWHFDGSWAVEAFVERCNIHDAIIYALNASLL